MRRVVSQERGSHEKTRSGGAVCKLEETNATCRVSTQHQNHCLSAGKVSGALLKSTRATGQKQCGYEDVSEENHRDAFEAIGRKKKSRFATESHFHGWRGNGGMEEISKIGAGWRWATKNFHQTSCDGIFELQLQDSANKVQIESKTLGRYCQDKPRDPPPYKKSWQEPR